MSPEFSGIDHTPELYGRLEAATKMFIVILDVAKRSFLIEEGKRWRSSLISVFYSFFNCLWCNEQVSTVVFIRIRHVNIS